MSTASLLMPTRVLIVGGGGREHALAWKLGAEPGVNEVIVGPGSDAIGREPRVRRVDVDPLDPAAVVVLAGRVSAELVVVGPEAPLAAGVADALQDAGIAVFGPSQAAARIESSKAYCHEVAEAAGVRMARAATFTTLDPAMAFARKLASAGDGVVVKADGLAAGKGVTVCDDLGRRADPTGDSDRDRVGGGRCPGRRRGTAQGQGGEPHRPVRWARCAGAATGAGPQATPRWR